MRNMDLIQDNKALRPAIQVRRTSLRVRNMARPRPSPDLTARRSSGIRRRRSSITVRRHPRHSRRICPRIILIQRLAYLRPRRYNTTRVRRSHQRSCRLSRPHSLRQQCLKRGRKLDSLRNRKIHTRARYRQRLRASHSQARREMHRVRSMGRWDRAVRARARI